MSGSPTPIAGKSYSYAEVKNLIQRTMRSTYYGTRQAEQQVSNSSETMPIENNLKLIYLCRALPLNVNFKLCLTLLQPIF
jgi:hypothetical protein